MKDGEKKFPEINVHFAFCWFVGIRGRNIAAALAKSPLAALKVLTEAHTEETATFLEQDSTIVQPFAYRSITLLSARKIQTHLRKAKKETLLQISQHSNVAPYAKSTGKIYSNIILPLHTLYKRSWNNTTQIK